MQNSRFHPDVAEAAKAATEIRAADSSEPFAFQRLDCYRVALELAARVHAASIADTELRDQATRASKSCFLTLCEGLPNDRPSMRRKYFTESNNSLHETVGAVDLACAIGAVDAAAASTVSARAMPKARALSARDTRPAPSAVFRQADLAERSASSRSLGSRIEQAITARRNSRATSYAMSLW
jgi:hypothetical protein